MRCKSLSTKSGSRIEETEWDEVRWGGALWVGDFVCLCYQPNQC